MLKVQLQDGPENRSKDQLNLDQDLHICAMNPTKTKGHCCIAMIRFDPPMLSSGKYDQVKATALDQMLEDWSGRKATFRVMRKRLGHTKLDAK